jgi:hypothetical protein
MRPSHSMTNVLHGHEHSNRVAKKFRDMMMTMRRDFLSVCSCIHRACRSRTYSIANETPLSRHSPSSDRRDAECRTPTFEGSSEIPSGSQLAVSPCAAVWGR